MSMKAREHSVSGLASRVRFLTAEMPEVVIYLDFGATEVVRWSGGVRWAVNAMGLWGPGNLRALSQLATAKEGEEICIVLTETIPNHLRMLVEKRAKYAIVNNDQLEDWCTSIGLRTSQTSLCFSAPLSSSNDDLVVTLFGRSSQTFPVLPWQSRSGSSTSFKADEVQSELRQELKALAHDIASLAGQLDMDIRRGARALGATAQLVTTAAITAASEKRRGQRAASIVIVDRTADLAGAARHMLDPPLLDRILTSISRHKASHTSGDFSCEPRIAYPRWGLSAVEEGFLEEEKAPPAKWSQGLQDLWPAGGSLCSALEDKDLAMYAFGQTQTGDEGLSSLTAACAESIRQSGGKGVQPKPGRGKGAELLEHLKVLLHTNPPVQDILKLAPLVWLAIDAAQRTRRPPGAPKPEAIEPLIDRLAVTGAEREQLCAVLLEARGRKALSSQAASILAIRACALSPGTISPATATALAETCQRPKHAIQRLESLNLQKEQTNLSRLLDDLLADRPTSLTPVGGALESFVGASIPGFSRLLGRSGTSPNKLPKSNAGNDAPESPDLLFFVIGGLTTSEVAALDACLRAHRRAGAASVGPQRRVVLASTTLISHNSFADRMLEDRFLVAKSF